MGLMSLGVVGTSFKENEHRAPIHPGQMAAIDADLRAVMWLEEGYGERFSVSDDDLRPLVAGLLPRAQLFADCDVMLIPKPTAQDFPFFREGQVIWGWPHCVQGPDITQVAIDKRLTMIAWEEMHHWDGDAFHLHVFHINNELAGYSSVLHALQLAGMCGHYESHRRAAVLGFGSTGRGAVHALRGQGYGDITVFTGRAGPAVKAPVPGLRHWQYQRTGASDGSVEVILDDGHMPMEEALGHFDIIVNCILQDTERPIQFVGERGLQQLKPKVLIIDVSCDEGMGFPFSKPTSFEEPWFALGDQGARYYAVDHSPSYLWNTATRNISRALRPFLREVLSGPEAWQANATLRRSIEIQDGVVQNPRILSFQGRAEAYPHTR